MKKIPDFFSIFLLRRMPRDLLEHTFDLIAGDYSDGSSSSDEGRPEMTEVETMTDPPSRIFIFFGEVFVRWQQIGDMFSRSVCGTELAEEIGKLGSHVEFFTVLPQGVVGEEIGRRMVENEIVLRNVNLNNGYGLGDVTMFADGRSAIHRCQSGFTNHVNEFKWKDGIISDKAPCWVHASCSSFTWSEKTKVEWIEFMKAACTRGKKQSDVLVSLELDSENSGVAMSGLWNMVQPYASKLSLLIITPNDLVDLLKLVQVDENVPDNSDGWSYQMRSLIKIIDCTCLVVAFTSDKKASLAVAHKYHGFTQSKPEDADVKAVLAKFMHAWAVTGSVENSYHFQQLVSGTPRPTESYQSSRRSMLIGARKSQRLDV